MHTLFVFSGMLILSYCLLCIKPFNNIDSPRVSALMQTIFVSVIQVPHLSSSKLTHLLIIDYLFHVILCHSLCIVGVGLSVVHFGVAFLILLGCGISLSLHFGNVCTTMFAGLF